MKSLRDISPVGWQAIWRGGIACILAVFLGLVLRRFGRDFPLRRSGADTFVTDLPRGGTETIAFGRGAGGRADYVQMNVWALARVP